MHHKRRCTTLNSQGSVQNLSARPNKSIPQGGNRTGAAVVEFAFIAPLMILLTMGMLEMGRVVMVKQLMVNASREGARQAVLPGATSGGVTSTVQEELSNGSISGATITVTPANFEGAAAGTPVTVSIQIDATDVSWVPNPAFTVQAIIDASTTMRKEGS